MSKCNYETWTLEEVSKALTEKEKDKKVIKVPQFQRSIVWSTEQQKKFIDSLKQGFPIGTLLFAKTIKDNQEVYELIDGLQRSNTIKNYISTPTKFFNPNDIPGSLISEIMAVLGIPETSEEDIDKVKICIIEFIQSYNGENGKDIESIQYDEFADFLDQKFIIINTDNSYRKQLKNIIKPFVDTYKTECRSIRSTSIPIIIYSGNEDYLPEIFARVNNQGTPLNQFQIYAALWSGEDNSVVINNDTIIKAILGKYKAMIKKGFTLYDYDQEKLLSTRKFNVYEYVFGFSKFIVDKFPHLFAFKATTNIEDVDSIGFELINACFQRKKEEISTLHNILKRLSSIDLFEKCILDTISDVDSILAPYISFKGNSNKTRKRPKIFHTKNQIISIIASTFLEKYDEQLNEKKEWKEINSILTTKIPLHYVFDILSKSWNEGGIGKAYSILLKNKYLQDIPVDKWNTMLDNWFTDQLSRKEKTVVASPSESEYLFLNCIYSEIFSYKEHSIETYDADHIVSKNYLKKAISNNNFDGMPISCIANICYVPISLNRSKKDKPLYKDKDIDKEKLNDIEKKYYFTKRTDLSWQAISTESLDGKFIDDYITFLKKRFKTQKNKFYESMKIK